MCRMRLLSAAVLISSLAAASALAGPTAADSAYHDYRIPEHRWWQWTAGLSGSFSHRDQSFPVDQSYRSGIFSGGLTTTASGGSDSDPLYQSWFADLRFGASRRHEEQLRTDPSGSVEGELAFRDVSESFALSYSIRAYPWAFPLGFTASTAHRFDLGQGFVSTDFRRTSPGILEQSLSSLGQGTWNYVGALGVGTGVGRVRDATPVYQAQVLEDRLLETGTLAHPLPRSTRERLAALFATQGRFVFAHGRPDKYFWEEIERILAEDGALANGSITLYDAHRLLEPLSLRGTILRPAGWFVGPSVVLFNQQTHRGTDRSQSMAVYQADTLLFGIGSEWHEDYYARQDAIQTAFVAEYHRPAGHRWQYDASSTTVIGESGVPLQAFTSASAAWIVTDRWLVTGTLAHAIEWGGHGTDRGVEEWNINAIVDLSYFLEDAWAVSLSARESQNHTSTYFRRSGDYFLGITRVISGLFEAPGLVSAMRPTPGGR